MSGVLARKGHEGASWLTSLDPGADGLYIKPKPPQSLFCRNSVTKEVNTLFRKGNLIRYGRKKGPGRAYVGRSSEWPGPTGRAAKTSQKTK